MIHLLGFKMCLCMLWDGMNYCPRLQSLGNCFQQVVTRFVDLFDSPNISNVASKWHC